MDILADMGVSKLTAKVFGNASFYSTVLTGYLQCTYLESTG